MAELARLVRVSRARITQILDLLLLAPEIQEDVLFAGIELTLKKLLGRGASNLVARAALRVEAARDLASSRRIMGLRPELLAGHFELIHLMAYRCVRCSISIVEAALLHSFAQGHIRPVVSAMFASLAAEVPTIAFKHDLAVIVIVESKLVAVCAQETCELAVRFSLQRKIYESNPCANRLRIRADATRAAQSRELHARNSKAPRRMGSGPALTCAPRYSRAVKKWLKFRLPYERC